MKRICVFCGSSPGSSPAYAETARALGIELARQGLGLVYGGGSVGMMGILAKSVLDNGGEVSGVITRYLYDMEVAYKGISDLRIVETMHERKAMMAEMSDGFIALPGGFGTMDEMFEIITWTQLSLQKKPCGFLNCNGYYDKLMDFIEHMFNQEFVNPECRALLQVDETPVGLLDRFRSHTPLQTDKGKWAKKLAVGL
jgi:uncharacterized protein (TIGR00730 family)